MKKQSKWIIALLAVATLFAFIFPLMAEDKDFAVISFLEGQAEARKGALEDYKPIKLGSKLTANYTIKTHKNSKLELTLPDDSILRVAPLSVVKLKSLLRKGKKKDNKANFKITAGKIWANVSKVVGKDEFEVSTNNAVAGVRGTIFQVDVMEDEATVVRVFSGAVAVANSPIYSRKEDTKGERVQVQGPQQVTKKQWEQLVAKAMQEVRVARDGVMKMTAIKPDISEDVWVKWNQQRDKKVNIEHK